MRNTEELRRIQTELKKPLPAPLHEVRELPGGAKKWVFLRWQTVRERLDEVVPDWTIDYSEIQYLGNDAICRCGITILGIRKEVIASVPITLMSKQGNDMARGSAADRLAAEALKNAAETWGVGRYLDDQPFTIRYLWDNRHSLDDRFVGEVRKLSEQYKMSISSREQRPQPKSAIPLSKPVSENLEVWRNWKSPDDAIAWAHSQLPNIPISELQIQFSQLEATNGKKAIAWVERIGKLMLPVTN